MATEITSSVQQKVKALEDFGFLKKASNKPSEALSQLQKQHLETELVIDNLIDKADAAVGNQSFLPEWSKTKAYFQNLRDSKQKALAPELEKITRDYALDPETGMRKIIKLKRQFSDDADFARANAPEKAELYQAAYLDLQELGERVFDAAVPQSKGAFKAANELASAEIGVTKTLPKAVARKNPGIFETLLTPTGSGYALGSSGLTAALLGNATIPGAAGLTWLGRGLYQGLKNTKPISFARTQDAISDFASLFSPLQKSGVGTTLLMSGLTDEDSNTTKNVGQEKEPVVSKQTQKPLRNSYNAPSNSANYIASSLFSPAKAEFKSIEAEIDKNPYYSALYEAESGRNPKAKNPKSTATGGFQFIKATAKSLGLDDPKDLAKSYEAVQRFTDEHRQRFGDDPGLLYAAHFLGAPLLSKVISNKNLSDEEEQQVSELRTKAMPRFLKIFNRINQNQLEA
jgi:hypothetical protein